MIIATCPIDALLEAVVLRGTQKLTLEIPVTEERSSIDQVADVSDPSKSLVTRLGIFGVEINDKLAAELPGLRRPSGVIVAALAADMVGVEIDGAHGGGDHTLNGKTVETLDHLRVGLRGIPSGAPGSATDRTQRQTDVCHLRDGVDPPCRCLEINVPQASCSCGDLLILREAVYSQDVQPTLGVDPQVLKTSANA